MLSQLRGRSFHRATVTVNLLAVIMVFNQSLPTNIRALLWVPNAVLMNIMACRVFRNTILGTINEAGSCSANFTSTEQRTEVIPLPLCGGDSVSGRSTQQSYEAGQLPHSTQKNQVLPRCLHIFHCDD